MTYVKQDGDEAGASGAVGSACTTSDGRAGSIVAGVNGALVCRPSDGKGPATPDRGTPRR